VSGIYILISALLLIVVVLANPNGIVSEVISALDWIVGRFQRRHSKPPAINLSGARISSSVAVRSAALSVSGVSVKFGGNLALDGVSLDVSPGEVLGLIGPNGAGKTTLIDAITGFERAYAGTIRLGDTDVTRWSATARARAGIARTFQSLELIDELSVADNVRLAPSQRRHGWRDLVLPHRSNALSETSMAAIGQLELQSVLDRHPRELSYADRRLVAIARAIAGAPSVLLLDEPAAGLDDRATERLSDVIRQLAHEWGVGVVLVEHDVSVVMTTCDRVIVLDHGVEILTAVPEVVRNDPRVIEVYLGGSAVGGQPSRISPHGTSGEHP
jgi:ABC-type branched-subunit amino acid transport system ATPase component